MYTAAPTEQELEASGLTIEDFAGEAVEVWPENLQAFTLFGQLQTQWRVGMGGATGLDYVALFHKMDRMNLGPVEYDDLEEDIRAMEYEAMRAMSKRE
jgi:hypothetical protein